MSEKKKSCGAYKITAIPNCGCRAVAVNSRLLNGQVEADINSFFCPLHSAADELCKTAKLLSAVIRKNEKQLAMEVGMYWLEESLAAVEAAIAKAEGKA